MKQILFIIQLAWWISSGLFAQNYTGVVLDEQTKRPVDAASVYLLSADSMIVAYAYADQQGRFSLSKPDVDARFLSFSCLGYKTFLVEAARFAENQTIFLAPAEIQLREVEVKTNRLYEAGDTLVYSVQGFKLPQDRNIADVLRKLPGITVADNGQIQYQGEAINRFYIEGLDLLGDKYNLASANLKADHVREIQVLQDHQPVKSLRGVQFSEQAALNLVLTDDAKAKWLASVDLGFGASPFLWDNRLLATAFKKNMQNLSMYKNNNAGERIADEVKSVRVEDLVWLQILPKESQGVFRPEQPASPPLDLSRYLFNESHLFTTNQLFRTSEESDLRMQFSYLHNRLENENRTDWNYFLPDSVVSIAEQIRGEEKHNELEGFLVFSQNKKDFFLKNKLSMHAHIINVDRDLFTNKEWVEERYKIPDYRVRNEFHLVKPVAGKVWNLRSVIQASYLPQHLTVSPGLYAGILNPDLDYSTLRQNGRVKEFLSHQLLSYSHMVKKIRLTYEAGLKLDRRKLTSALSLTNATDAVWLSPDFVNETNLNESSLYFSPEAVYQHNKLKATIALKMDYSRFAPYETDLFAVHPKITLTYDITPWWDMTLRFTEDRRPMALENSYTGLIFTNYRRIERSEGWFEPMRNRSYSLTSAYRNPVKGYFIQGGITFQELDRNTLSNLTYDGSLQIKQTMGYGHKQNNLQSMLKISKSFATLNTRLFLDLYHLRTKAGQLSGDALLLFENQSYSADAKAIIQPSKWLNAEYKLYWFASRMKMAGRSFDNTDYFRHSLAINILPSKAWQFNATPTYYHGEQGRISNLFLDAYTSYRWGNKELILSARHIGGNGYYEHHTLSNLMETTVRYKTRPAQVLLKFAFAI